MGKKSKKEKSSTKEAKQPEEMYHNGTGDFELPNGDKYSGEYCAHRFGLVWREGKGVYTTHDGQVYIGTWKDDKLLDNEPVTIYYANGHEFNGRLLKGKYSGPGTYLFKPNQVVSTNFVGNQMSKETILIDKKNWLWLGDSKPSENYSVVRPLNVFYEYLDEDEGKGEKKETNEKSKMKKDGESSTEATVSKHTTLNDESVTETEEEKAERFRIFREEEQKIFAKSPLIDTNVDFAKSHWYQDYKRYLATRKKIEAKLVEAGQGSLTSQEKCWISKYQKWKRSKKYRETKKLEKPSEKVDTSLLDKFNSEEYKESCPGVPTIYPRWTWDTFFEGDGWNPDYVPAGGYPDNVIDEKCVNIPINPEDEVEKVDKTTQVKFWEDH